MMDDMEQPDLFDIGERDVFGIGKMPRVTCTPAAVGSGPKGKTCRTCRHKVRKVMGSVYLKCALTRKYWSNGKATDIKARWPACGRYETSEKVGLDNDK